MTLPVDDPPPDNGPAPSPPGDVHADLARIGRAIDRAAESALDAFSPAELIDRTAVLETLRHRLAAVQSRTTLTFARAHAAERTKSGEVEPEKLERSIAAQIGLACHVSPIEGRKRVRTARDLNDGLDHLRRMFHAGRISAYTVSTVVGATSHLDAAERAEVDRLLRSHDLEKLGVGRIREKARQLAAQVAPEKFRLRCAAARSGRRVTLRPAVDGMTDLVAHLPVEQGVACYAALRKAFDEVSVNPAPMTRTRGQVMADTLVERVTGEATADRVNVQVQVVVPVEALVDPGCPLPAEIPGHGPVPVEVLATATGRKTWRKVVTKHGVVIGGDSTQRKFTGFLADLVRARDGNRCREPYCDAPIRDIDHIRRRADGGPTSFRKGRGTCVLHNQLREQPGWHVDETDGDIRTTTPTGHTYTSGPPRRT